MPSIIFHLTEAKLITQHLREASADYPFTHIHGWQNDFTIGSILPDAIPRPLKYKTHFWHPSDFSHVVIAPDLNLWQKTYPNTLKEPMLIGYLAHLHLDYLFLYILLYQVHYRSLSAFYQLHKFHMYILSAHHLDNIETTYLFPLFCSMDLQFLHFLALYMNEL